MNHPLISIALCTYNGEKYLSEQIESITAQSYTNLEIIIVDDASTDTTFEIVKSYALLDKRIMCIQNETNLGFNKNFEKALGLATGQFIAISDQDDIWEPHKIEMLFEHIGDNWLVFSNSVLMNEDGKTLGRKMLDNFWLADKSYKALLINNYITGHTLMVSREFLSRILPLPAKGFYDWWIRFIAHYHKRLAFADEVLTRYRQHGQAVTNEHNMSAQKLKSMYFRRTLTQIEALLLYTGYKKTDHDYMIKLHQSLKIKLNKTLSAPLFKLVMDDYDDLFPFNQKLKGMRRVAFALKFSLYDKG
jgi:glycosyltransferase involved in cell wall biosynthesis